MTEEYQSFKDKKLSEEILEISNNLKKIEEVDVRKLPEYIFANVFLPLFAGDEKLLYNVDIGTWINYAGSPFKPVDIIDKHNKVLFRVPPILDNNAVDSLSSKTLPLAHIVATANQYAQFHPSQGYNYLTAELHNKVSNTKSIDDYKKELDTWNSIFKRYNRKPIVVVEQTKQQEKTITTPTTLNCDFDLM